MLNAIILAGEQPVGNWNEQFNKALFRINGKTMAEYVISAIRNVEGIDKVIIIGDKKKLEESLKYGVDAVIESSGSITESLMAGLDYLGRNIHTLVCTSDIPLITPEAINEFVDKSKASKVDFCYPVVEKKVNDSKYPEMERSYIKIKEGSFTGGNIFYVNPNIIKSGLTLVEKILEFKKNPVKMAGILGFGLMMEYSMGSLTLEKIEKKFSNISNIKVKAVITEHPEIAFDVDKPGDVIVATANLSK